MNTRAASIIRAMEAVSSAHEQASIQARYPTDVVFREVLEATYDPYAQYGAPKLGRESRLPDIDEAPVSTDEALGDEWSAFDNATKSGMSFADLQKAWGGSLAWPVYARVLHKHFRGVEFRTVNGVWGTLPLFDVGDVSLGEVSYPAYAIPVVSRARRLFVVRVVQGSKFRIDLFAQTGLCLTDSMSDAMREGFRTFPWREWFVDADYQAGVVLDGWMKGDSGEEQTYWPFDCVPLAVFREQRLTQPFLHRRGDLEYLGSLGLYVPTLRLVPALLVDDPKQEPAALSMLERSADGRGVIGADVQAPYPYRPTHAWRWIQPPVS